MSGARLTELEAVLAVATRKSFRAAARDLEVSPSALSHTIATMEKRLGVRLFHRTTRTVALSPAGAQFVERVAPALRDISAALEAAHEAAAVPTGSLKLTCGRAAAHQLFPLLLEYRRRYPAVKIELNTEERLIDLVAEGYDAGLRLAEAVPRDMVAIPIGPKTISMEIVGSPAYFAKYPKPKSPQDLAKHECIRRRAANGSVFRWELEKRGREIALEIDGQLTLDNDDLVLEAALAGAGLAFVGSTIAEPHRRAGRLVRVLSDWTPPFPGARLFHPSGRLVRAALRAFIDLVRERPLALVDRAWRDS